MKKNTLKYDQIHLLPRKFLPIMFMAFFSINVLGLVLPLTLKKIYSSVAISKSVTTLRYILFAALLALIFESLLRKSKESASKWIAAKYEYELSTFLMDKYLNSYDHQSHHFNYTVDLEKFNATAKIASFHSTRYYQLFVDLPFVFIYLISIYYFGGIMVLAPITLSLLYVAIMYLLAKKHFENKHQLINDNDLILDHLTESLDKIHLIKAAGIEDSVINRYRSVQNNVTVSTYESNKFEALPRIIASSFSQLNLFTILIIGGFLVLNNRITFAEITACVMLGGRAIAPVISIMKQYFNKKDIQVLKARIDSIANLENQYSNETPDFPDDINGSIELIDLSYNNVQTKELEYLSSRIPAGSFVRINPAEFLSYQSVINKIAGKENIHSGKILIDNLNIQLWNMTSLRGKIEFLNTHVNIYKGSILENITFFDRTKLKHGYDAAALTGLDSLVAKQAEGFETKIDSYSVNHLSSAFLQRLNLTRALLYRPRILILDRIDESMDNETYETFKWLLNKFKGGITIIIASNRKDIIELADFELKPNMKG